MQDSQLIPIRKAAEMLEVSVDTSRRWDRNGYFPAIKSSGGHRYYSMDQVELFRKDIFSMAKSWVAAGIGTEPEAEFYCPNSGVFQVRLIRMEKELLETRKDLSWASLIVSAVGEIGNNSFDHNLGNWRDIPGVFYGYDLRKKQVVLADRGQGVLATLRRVKSELATDRDALHTAFTEVISGRAPEARGNGLKLVRLIVERYPLSIDFSSGNALATLRHDKKMRISLQKQSMEGCIACIRF